MREKLIPNDATRNGKKIFCREVRAPSLPVTISPLPPGPTRNSRENRVHVWTRAARLRTYLVSPVRITAHSYALHPLSLSLFTSFLSPLPSSRACIYIFFALPPPLEYFPRAAQRKRFEKENFLNLSRDIYILRACDVSRNNNYPLHWKNRGDPRGGVK